MSSIEVDFKVHTPTSISPHEVYKDNYKNSCLYQTKVNDKTTSFKGLTNIALLGVIEKFVDKVKCSLDVGFIEVKSKTPSLSLKHCKQSTFAFQFKLVDAFYDCVLQHSHYYIYSENVQLFKDAYEEVGLSTMRLTDPGFYIPVIDMHEFEVFNQLITLIRHKCHSPSFSARVVHRQRELNRKFREYSEYVNQLFKNCSRLLVVRIDLSYFVGHDEQNNRTKHLVTLEEVKADFYRLLSNKRHNAIFDDLVGYVWKLEYGDLKGYHYHLILFFNGNNVKGDFKKGKEIGDYWSDVITKGRGYYFNSNGKKSDYAHLGIGMINAEGEEDAHLRFNLIHYVLSYLVKSGQYLKVKLKMNDRSIGKGVMPKEKSKAGRPRKALRVLNSLP